MIQKPLALSDASKPTRLLQAHEGTAAQVRSASSAVATQRGALASGLCRAKLAETEVRLLPFRWDESAGMTSVHSTIQTLRTFGRDVKITQPTDQHLLRDVFTMASFTLKVRVKQSKPQA